MQFSKFWKSGVVTSTALMASLGLSQGMSYNVASAASSPQTLIFYTIQTSNQPWLTSVFNPFEKKYNVHIKIIAIDSTTFMQKFMAAVNANQPADVLDLNGQDLRFLAENGIVQDLSKEVDYLNRFRPAALAPYILNGQDYALPFGSMNSSGLYYNTAIFKKYGLKPPHTFQDMLHDGSVLRAHHIIPIGFGGETIYMWPMWFFQTFSQVTGNKADQQTAATLEGKIKFTAPQYVKAMDDLALIGKAGLFESGVNGVNTAGGEALFTTGKAAMFYGGTWEIPTFMKGKSPFAVAPFPLFSNSKVNFAPATGGSGDALTIYSKIEPSHQKVAEALIQYLTSNSIQKQMMVETDGLFSSNDGVNGTIDTPVTREFLNGLLPKTFTFLDWYWPPQVTTAFQQNIQGVIGGQETPMQALENVQQVYDQLVAGGYKFQ